MFSKGVSNLVLAEWSRGQTLTGVSKGASLLANIWMERDKNCVVTDFSTDSTYSTRRYMTDLYRSVYQSFGQYPFTCVLGGDHSISEASVSAFFEKYRESGHLLWIDAHPDIQLPETSLSGNSHGMPMSAILGLMQSNVPKTYIPHPSQITYVGIRDIDLPEGERLQQLSCYYGPDLLDFGKDWSSWVISRLNRKLTGNNTSKIYVSFDVDVLDPSEITNTGTPVSDGLRGLDVADFLQGLRVINGVDIVGMDIVEFNPEAGVVDRVDMEANHILDIARKVL